MQQKITILMFAIVIGLAGAFGGLASGIFSSYSDISIVTVEDVYLSEDGTGSMTLRNKGSTDDAVTLIYMSSRTFVPTSDQEYPIQLPSNSRTMISFEEEDIVETYLEPGQDVALKLKLKSGMELVYFTRVASG